MEGLKLCLGFTPGKAISQLPIEAGSWWDNYFNYEWMPDDVLVHLARSTFGPAEAVSCSRTS